jgi:hypothetical protein
MRFLLAIVVVLAASVAESRPASLTEAYFGPSSSSSRPIPSSASSPSACPFSRAARSAAKRSKRADHDSADAQQVIVDFPAPSPASVVSAGAPDSALRDMNGFMLLAYGDTRFALVERWFSEGKRALVVNSGPVDLYLPGDADSHAATDGDKTDLTESLGELRAVVKPLGGRVVVSDVVVRAPPLQSSSVQNASFPRELRLRRVRIETGVPDLYTRTKMCAHATLMMGAFIDPSVYAGFLNGSSPDQLMPVPEDRLALLRAYRGRLEAAKTATPTCCNFTEHQQKTCALILDTTLTFADKILETKVRSYLLLIFLARLYLPVPPFLTPRLRHFFLVAPRRRAVS